MKFMYASFEEYAAIIGLTPAHPDYEAYKMIWSMARTPHSVIEALAKNSTKKRKK